jgi:acid phosphatase
MLRAHHGLFAAAAAIVFLAAHPAWSQASGPVPQNDLLNATLWQSNSVEYKANATIVYELARLRLDAALADKNWSAVGQTDAAEKPPAVILDLDETVFDNSGYEAWLVKAGKDYSGKTYDAWTKAVDARAIPGAIEFLKYADSKGVKLFYVTNRDVGQEEATRKNAEKLGLPMGGNVDTFLMSKEKEDWTSKKGTRRAFIAENYRILLLLGDNYGDFSDDYGGSEADRLKSLQANMAHVGHDWIFIANPEYGSFESAPFLSDYSKSPDERRQLKINVLPAWSGPPQ